MLLVQHAGEVVRPATLSMQVWGYARRTGYRFRPLPQFKSTETS
jgi:hypothetical protein